MMVVQAYIDDSYTEGGVHVLAGYIARAENWAAFSAEWEVLLSKTFLGKNAVHRFKMSEMAQRMDEVPAFYDVIRHHAAFCANIMINEIDVQRAKERIWSDNARLVWSPDDSVKNLLFRLFVNNFFFFCWQHENIRQWLSPQDRIDLYIDRDTVPEYILDRWDEMIDPLPAHIKEVVGDKPRSVDDETFLPLQAADFWSWWVREAYETGRVNELQNGDFGSWIAPKVSGFWLNATEDQIVTNLINMFKGASSIPGLVNVYDAKVTPRNERAVPSIGFDKRSAFKSYMASKIKLFRLRRIFWGDGEI